MYRIVILISAFLLSVSGMLYVQGADRRNPAKLIASFDSDSLVYVTKLSAAANQPLRNTPSTGANALAAADAASAAATAGGVLAEPEAKVGGEPVIAAPLSGAATDGPSGVTHYIVQPGDSLASIARRFYGSPSDFTRIFEANRGQIVAPEKIQVGQILLIPG